MNGLISCVHSSSGPSTFYLYGLLLAVLGVLAALFYQGNRFIANNPSKQPLRGVYFASLLVLWAAVCGVVSGLMASAAANGHVAFFVCTPHSRMAPLMFIGPALIAVVLMTWFHLTVRTKK